MVFISLTIRLKSWTETVLRRPSVLRVISTLLIWPEPKDMLLAYKEVVGIRATRQNFSHVHLTGKIISRHKTMTVLLTDVFSTYQNRTLRLWNVEDVKQHKNIMKCRSQSGLRAAPGCCAYSRDGILIASGCTDGSIQMWDHRRAFVSN